MNIIINADLSNVYTTLEAFNLIHDALQPKQNTLTSNSTVNVEEITCHVSSNNYGLIINRTTQTEMAEYLN